MDVIQPQLVCENCAAELSPATKICAACGHAMGPKNATSFQRISVPSVRHLSRWQVLAILFLGIGVLGLPILWRNENFNWLEKLAVAVLLIACTVFVVGSLWYVLMLAAQPVMDLIEMMRSG